MAFDIERVKLAWKGKLRNCPLNQGFQYSDILNVIKLEPLPPYFDDCNVWKVAFILIEERFDVQEPQSYKSTLHHFLVKWGTL